MRRQKVNAVRVGAAFLERLSGSIDPLRGRFRDEFEERSRSERLCQIRRAVVLPFDRSTGSV